MPNYKKLKINETFNVGIVGLGYVGFNLLEVVSKSYNNVYGYDISKNKIKNLKKKYKKFKYNISFDEKILKNCNFFIVCVPTPVLSNNKPDLSFLINACKKLSKVLKKDDHVVFESTVYPGVTEKVCIPNLVKNRKQQKLFNVGYAPERYSPGEKKILVKLLK